MTMETTITTEKIELRKSNGPEWVNSEWYKEWERLAAASHVETKVDGYWVCYNNEKNELIYEYVRM